MRQKELADAINTKLKQIQQALKYTNTIMAQKMSITPGNYRRNAKRKAMPQTYTLYNLAASLDISLDWLLLDKGDMFCKDTEADAEETPTPPAEQPLSSDLKELVDHMERIPLLRFEMLNHFHKFKEANRKIIEREMNPEK
jgi:transcriptional regulator with XRE-family HTH domain